MVRTRGACRRPASQLLSLFQTGLLGAQLIRLRPADHVRVRYFVCNTPPAYAVASVLHRPVEFASKSGRSQLAALGRTRTDDGLPQSDRAVRSCLFMGKTSCFVDSAVVTIEGLGSGFPPIENGKVARPSGALISTIGVLIPQIASMRPRASIVAQNAIHLAAGVADNPSANCPGPKS